jgi:hypothetical protein
LWESGEFFLSVDMIPAPPLLTPLGLGPAQEVEVHLKDASRQAKGTSSVAFTKRHLKIKTSFLKWQYHAHWGVMKMRSAPRRNVWLMIVAPRFQIKFHGLSKSASKTRTLSSIPSALLFMQGGKAKDEK